MIDQEEPQVIINGKRFLYRQKAPFVASGHSVKGAMEYDSAAGRLKCHECGRWFRHVGSHAYQSHGILSDDYKRKHGLRLTSCLVAEDVREKLIASGLAQAHQVIRAGMKTRLRTGQQLAACRGGRARMEVRNENGTCHAQLLEKIQNLAREIGRTPTIDEAREAGISVASANLAFSCGWAGVMKIAGLNVRAPGVRIRFGKRYSPEALLAILREFYAEHRRNPCGSDVRRGIIPTYSTFAAYFGSIKKAYALAGLPSSIQFGGRSSVR